MASSLAPPLPADLFHLLSTELAHRLDFATLFNCVASSKYLGNAGSVSALYRISLGDQSPSRSSVMDNLSPAESDIALMRWSILWRTVILSALGKTMYPYCRHLRSLDLRDFSALLDRLDETRSRKVAKQFFASHLSGFHHVSQTTGKYRATRLNSEKILAEVGDIITQQAPLLEGIAEPSTSDVLSSTLPAWAPRLTHLHELELWDGKALEDEDLRKLLHTHCPKLNKLRIYLSSGSDPDKAVAAFVSGMPQDALRSFEIVGGCSIGPATCLAINGHGRSLTSLKLALDENGILALGLLQGCTQLQTLHVSTPQVTAMRPSVDLKAIHNDVYLEIVDWLRQCAQLTEIFFNDVVSAPDLLLPVLLNGDVKLRTLGIKAKEGSMYQAKDQHDFHSALSTQSSLKHLDICADPDIMTRDDIEIVLNSLCHLTELQTLQLFRISHYFSDEHIKLLAQHLPRLDALYIGGYGITDDVWSAVGTLKYLKSITFAGITAFTSDGILSFIEKLGEGNTGLVLSIEMADPDTMIPEEVQETLRGALASSVNGRFEYQPSRDPNVPEFDGSDSD
ncbi:hypothetical protein LTR91_016651 [Friedmanniomyces endolithicus]|uniref:F-box domain-containing protein n=1 Tax=Friedmanniomyces endolithicus TaxID=329885 RepID=A0AAN6QKM8_9PEZI|nr:hypothetical protein LTR94_013043 [Friedmanniomyces endolithicus]KAK0779816.1 hypothetical protein LTR59_013050 [Friedmanniomyces endolithicus]KAK0794189.1 hypothetical protein LTR75_010911 [Friedmanniomyces endolithicus]KAK0818734.1 hypothetical protein LTR38_000832 [Friedmanniomyces endolithicus]KAK0838549.1 hypothetical protein LTR03_011913 [Friedmanniomyces endolithicus]